MRRISLDQLEESIDRQKAALGLSGDSYVLSNSGTNRTDEKRDLLRALALNAAEQGRMPVFQAGLNRPRQ